MTVVVTVVAGGVVVVAPVITALVVTSQTSAHSESESTSLSGSNAQLSTLLQTLSLSRSPSAPHCAATPQKLTSKEVRTTTSKANTVPKLVWEEDGRIFLTWLASRGPTREGKHRPTTRGQPTKERGSAAAAAAGVEAFTL